MLKPLKDITPAMHMSAGGKGSMLARMFREGYPVPEGLVVFPAAFREERLCSDAWMQILECVKTLRKRHRGALFAVRSSAMNEDSALASFAGEFESVLNVKTDDEIREAIHTVFRSKEAERVKAYSRVQGRELPGEMAVVIQLMVQAEMAGVLFTADPVTGSFTHMTGNYVHGSGEQLVSGKANALIFKLARPGGEYEGPAELKKYAHRLYKWAGKLEKMTGSAQDIEWAVAGKKIYLLQARPVTTLVPGNPDTYEINDTLSGDALWVNTNVGEAMPDVATPFSWSFSRALDREQSSIPGYYTISGHIGGRVYTNISLRLSVMCALYGFTMRRSMSLISESFGMLPEGITIPRHPFNRWDILRIAVPHLIRMIRKLSEVSRQITPFNAENAHWCAQMIAGIKDTETKEGLLALWNDELKPAVFRAWWILLACTGRTVIAMNLKKKLFKLVGTEEANALMSNIRGNAALDSLGPVTGIARVIKGEMSREEYLNLYGHRSPHEFELSIPHPGEDTGWLDRQIEDYQKAGSNVEELLARQHTRHTAAMKRFRERFPRKAAWLEKMMEKVSAAACIREKTRSGFVRVWRVMRPFLLKAGELTGIGKDIFFLYMDELTGLLAGSAAGLKHIPARKETYNRYKALPPYPAVIRGRFDPFKWAEDPQRRFDYFDATLPADAFPDSETLVGFTGAAGRVEGTVRVLLYPEEGVGLLPGEILVTTATNVGWTPLFPKAAAIITDVGAPLSHAAIVARELGIPAVVGCRNATTRLKTGDRVLVDGGQGVVYRINCY